ncbi:unnamed protein product [Gulo gulo]|uniref:Uncharacterized protein n=1 Tax=Gulo gulo TaxID=48420 RepID=A0A9X9PSY3_GULGU|nr:unnamed protein product [Gulo gulo]
MAAIPSSSWLVATPQYDQCCLGSTSSNRKCRVSRGSCPSPPRLPMAHLGCWWASCFFQKSTLPLMAAVLESPEHSESPPASSSTITMSKPSGGQPGKAKTRPQS